jgi:hypothetical protein
VADEVPVTVLVVKLAMVVAAAALLMTALHTVAVAVVELALPDKVTQAEVALDQMIMEGAEGAPGKQVIMDLPVHTQDKVVTDWHLQYQEHQLIMQAAVVLGIDTVALAEG